MIRAIRVQQMFHSSIQQLCTSSVRSSRRGIFYLLPLRYTTFAKCTAYNFRLIGMLSTQVSRFFNFFALANTHTTQHPLSSSTFLHQRP